VITEFNSKAYVLIFLAPSEHYFAAQLPEVEAIIASILQIS
jgi:hypothetical protein